MPIMSPIVSPIVSPIINLDSSRMGMRFNRAAGFDDALRSGHYHFTNMAGRARRGPKGRPKQSKRVTNCFGARGEPQLITASV